MKKLVLRNFVAACLIGVTGHSAMAENAPSSSAECGAPAGWEDVADAAEGRVLFFGEIHGNAETPDAFARYVCAASSRGGRTLVLLEWPNAYEPALEQAAVSNDPRSALLSGMARQWESTDGRGSAAMLDMAARILTMAQANENLSVQPATNFPLKKFPTPEETQAWVNQLTPAEIQEIGEAGMASEVLRRSAGYDRTIFLVGNLHAALEPVEGMPVEPAAMRTPDAMSIRVIHSGGTSWVNTVANGPGIQTYEPSSEADLPANTMGLSDLFAPHFDGFLSLGPITASPPAMDVAE